MANPSPVPPKFREVDVSACVNCSKIIFCFSCAIPIPVSSTRTVMVMVASVWLFTFISSNTNPFLVNLMALFTRLVTTWPMRVGSASILLCKAGSICSFSSIPFSSADVFKPEIIFLTTLARSVSMDSKFTFPASILL